MCGLAGLLLPAGEPVEPRVLRRMTDAIAHRGPDAEGRWQDPEAGIHLGHRRLSILDLSPQGAQPMASASGRYCLVFNGEIYNHLALRRELEQRPGFAGWRGGSDTETLLAGIEAWGLPETLRRAMGMFALALWDRQERRLTLARDRLGEKPLYLARLARGYAFASELKAITSLPQFSAQLDPQALALYLRLGHVPEGHAIYQGVSKVPPGCLFTLEHAAAAPEVETYWSLAQVAGQERLQGELTDDLLEQTEALLQQVVAEQMVSDVPLGSFLSGGIDSSLVTALMQKAAAQPVKSFSIGFAEARFDEAGHAAAVASHLGTEHRAFMVTERDALAVLPDLPRIYDEPFADSSQIPTLLLSRLTRQAVTVALTGDGGDESFGGYNRYVFGPALWRRLRHLPGPLRRRAPAMTALLHRLGRHDGSLLRRLLGRAGLPITLVDKLSALGEVARDADSPEALYGGFVSTFARPEALMTSPVKASLPRPALPELSQAEWMMAMDSLGYLPGDILVKVDRAAMSCSLETRAPFLDARVVEQAWRLPSEARIAQRSGKVILRRLLRRHLPADLFERPKQGFSIPLDRWLRGELRDWAESHLSEAALRDSGLLQPQAVRRLWHQHLSGRANHGQKLWTLLMLQSWQQEQKPEIAQMAA